MALIVQKFGGTSVADSEKILASARKAIRALREGHHVVMVVSAMGQQTDHLIELARQVSEHPPAREMDMLLSTGEQVSVALVAMAVEELGYKAISLTGAQVGIRTDSTHGKARIRSISTERMKAALDQGQIVIVAGFQGMDEDFNITTLGRGGSDTTAVALAAVLQADVCEIYTDVDGVYTTDPRLLPEARLLRQVSYDEMLELASLGAGVMHSRAIEFGKKFGVPIHVRSSFSDAQGTLIADNPETPGHPVNGAALVKDEARVTILGVPDRPGTSLAIFSKISDRAVPVDMIVQNVGAGGRADISFTVLRDDLRATLMALREAAAELGAEGVEHSDNLAKVSVVGVGMASQRGVAAKTFRALAEAGINIVMITTSEIKITVLVERENGAEALRAVHQAWALDQPAGDGIATTADTRRVAPRDPMAIVARLQGMEDLTVSDVSLDDTQGRVTVSGVPDRPGLAAAIFTRLAEHDVFVDMIVQSEGRDGLASLSFSVPQADIERSLDVARELTHGLGCGPVTCSPRIAKLSVSGVGLRSHTGVAIRMFKALAKADINVELINTSEVRVTAVVAVESGQRGLESLQAAFADTAA